MDLEQEREKLLKDAGTGEETLPIFNEKNFASAMARLFSEIGTNFLTGDTVYAFSGTPDEGSSDDDASQHLPKRPKA